MSFRTATAPQSTAAPAVAPDDSLLERIKYKAVWIATITLIFCPAMVLNVLQAAALPIYVVSKRTYRLWIELICHSYSCLLVFLLEWKSGLRPVFYGDANDFFRLKLDSAIYMSNHTSYADWVVFYGVMCRQGNAGALRFFLKDLAKVLPGIGWGCYLSEFFLVRKAASRGNWDRDGDVIVNRLRSFTETGCRIFPAIFPEGTFHDGADPTLVERTQAFAAKNNLTVLQYLLTPRTRGFVACTQHLRGHAKYILDQTIAFTGNQDASQTPYQTAKPLSDASRVMPDAADLLSYRGPQHAHLHMRLIPLSDVPADEEGAKQFLMRLWDEKEQLLKEFHRTGRFPGATHERPHALFGPARAGGAGFLFFHFALWMLLMLLFGWAMSKVSMLLLINTVLVLGACAVAGMLVQHFWKDK